MTSSPEAMKGRTKSFALGVIRLIQGLPEDRVSGRLGDQLLRAATSVGANYRAACRARSRAEFRSRLGIVEEEADESMYWMELLLEAGFVPHERCDKLIREANEIVSIVVASIKTSALGERHSSRPK